MSDLSDFIAEMDKDEELRRIEDEKYFKEQDEKFQELHKKLVQLKDENKRQMDVIINSLDELIASKSIVEKTLEQMDGTDILVPEETKNLTVVEILSKFTGYVDDTNGKNIMSTLDTNIKDVMRDITFSNENEKDSKDCCIDNNKTERSEDMEIKNDVKTEIEKEVNSEEDESLNDNTKLFENLCINSAGDCTNDEKLKVKKEGV